MRCKRCHAKLENGRKTCPYCGTLVRKRRGNIKLAAESGVEINPFADFVSDTVYKIQTAVRRDRRIIPAAAAALILLIFIISLISCAPSCSCACTGRKKEVKTGDFGILYDSRAASLQTSNKDGLYCIVSDSVIMRSSDESYRTLCTEVSASCIAGDETYIYICKPDGIYKIDPQQIYMTPGDVSAKVVDCSGDPLFALVDCTAADGILLYKMRELGGSSVSLYVSDTVAGTTTLVAGGNIDDAGFMGGRVYYCRTDAGVKTLYSCGCDGTDEKAVVSDIADYELGGGYIYYTVPETDASPTDARVLVRLKASSAKEVCRWDIPELTGGNLRSFKANDMWLCICAGSDDGDSIYRIEHDSPDLKRIAYFSKRVELTAVSGNWYAFMYNVDLSAEDPYANARYTIRDSLTDKTAVK